MDNTREFVDKLHEQQNKERKNQEHQGKGSPGNRLPNKQHSTNK
ncbi:DUF4023 domain-containing protein [Paenibacillus spiritus]|uniref:DUF4023 domain-containing protein n=1 Tax=Paenibacillus spiritus TaxID=2496557 RepID=A0A5J5FX37_9BACL|nr:MULTISPECIES: DUF4023 domain-containing protein [Paenibacillus]KAA8997539.1 DUF4023 domain-containing protein [Paenibacillus spiritus]